MNNNLSRDDGTAVPTADSTVPAIDMSQVYLYLKRSPTKSAERKPSTYVGYTIKSDAGPTTTTVSTVASNKSAPGVGHDEPKKKKKPYKKRNKQRGLQRKDQVEEIAEPGARENQVDGEEEGAKKDDIVSTEPSKD